MTETTAPDTAVQIAAAAICPGEAAYYYDDARKVVAALARAGWLHDPTEIERDRDAARAEIDRLSAELRKRPGIQIGNGNIQHNRFS